ncbi:hypothetical protein [Kibdelosporangium aridum]|uniref:hypothetical protein n=1 Tax=Kibdelosporangium aridum TaxID=2030 RepID=UPI0005246B84
MSTPTPPGLSLSRREWAMLKAIAAGRGEITGSSEPDLFIDSLACCDQHAAHHLARADLVHATRAVEMGQRVPAELTAAGHALLRDLETAA